MTVSSLHKPTSAEAATTAPALDYKIVPGEPSDAEAIASLGGRVFYESFAHSMPADDMATYLATTYTRDLIHAEMLDARHTFFVARDTASDRLLGFAQLTTGSSEPCLSSVAAERGIELQRIYTDSAAHGRGIGSALFDRALEYARPRYDAVWLGVWEENEKAQRFYTRHGFHRVGEHDFKIGTCVQTDWILERHFEKDEPAGR
ncbi:uncharacterized protein PFL1_01491 [Pseudozyma flocculosa PF-1]|uniref:N-acetyltransferase domain-containing protein n=1 Tax=Pseudozyma flocculosa TaxID=84751 RepID=A0A5C3FEH3_9BASI|nr:uncharacterized protein PFL1_01491 [Pseudozyma flocculosa PF-1]EPQ31306.1 hypothetical protein PFL1_01491 [Pseudozyma flocculosa PF-1]SPO41769.1 uncharacterized protein PSFLO_07251 [Pseudozyma flocculosa]